MKKRTRKVVLLRGAGFLIKKIDKKNLIFYLNYIKPRETKLQRRKKKKKEAKVFEKKKS